LFGVAAAVQPASPVQLSLDSLAVEHVVQGRYPGFVTVATGISMLDGAQLGHSAAIFQGPKCLALCETLSLHLRDGRAEPPSADIRATLEQLRFRA
jgi:hypothetical protein